MQPLTAPTQEIAALAEGRAAVDLSSYRKVQVQGSDARRWLHDLVTTDVASLTPGQARRSLLLDPTGHIRADVHVACDDDGFWLLQASDQLVHIGEALAPFVLSSDVRLADMTSERGLASLGGEDTQGFAPSTLGRGHDLLVGAGADLGALTDHTAVGADAVEVLRIREGRARMGHDFDGTSIPAEAGLEVLIDITKGCFLGQESVARVRNLGHPPRVLLHLTSPQAVAPGAEIANPAGETIGVVTSAATAEAGGTVLLASVRWAARDGTLLGPDGTALSPVRKSD
ncbi:MAG: hypothetical protein M3Q20_02965 [Actinomycetota bacterium]|nr:hypothetical protein [Actinomycetota bacterium]